jgi:hypothetical protein
MGVLCGTYTVGHIYTGGRRGSLDLHNITGYETEHAGLHVNVELDAGELVLVANMVLGQDLCGLFGV